MGFWNWLFGTDDTTGTATPWRDAEGSVSVAREDIAAEFKRRGIAVPEASPVYDMSFKRADVVDGGGGGGGGRAKRSDAPDTIEVTRLEIRRREVERSEGFRDRVRALLRERFGGDRKAFYEAAGLDRRLFSKMVSYEDYAPSKETAIAVALAARLTLDEVLPARSGSPDRSPKREMTASFRMLDRAPLPRGAGAIVCMAGDVGAVSADTLVLPAWAL